MKIQHELEAKFGSRYGEEEAAAILDILKKNAPTSGEACIAFEEAFARYCGVAHARACSNGTAALFLSLKALGIGPGDRVLTTPLTWIATAAAGATLGAEVDFVDVDPDSYNLDPEKLTAKLTPNTKAVLPVHLYGQCADMDHLLALSRTHGFALVEDACHAIGAEYKGKKAGTMGESGCFSFHEQKNISTLGEGGMIITNNAALFEQIALYRSHCTRVYGASTKYCSLDEAKFPQGKRFWYQDFDDCGYNFRMTDIQAAVGLVQLGKLDALNAQRILLAEQLTERLATIPGLRVPRLQKNSKHVFHLYPLEIDADIYGLGKEDLLFNLYHEKGIKLGTHYIPLHYSTAFQQRGMTRGMFPVAEALYERLVTIPVHPRWTQDAVDYLIDSLRSYCKAL